MVSCIPIRYLVLQKSSHLATTLFIDHINLTIALTATQSLLSHIPVIMLVRRMITARMLLVIMVALKQCISTLNMCLKLSLRELGISPCSLTPSGVKRTVLSSTTFPSSSNSWGKMEGSKENLYYLIASMI